jgi:hypothetical protein
VVGGHVDGDDLFASGLVEGFDEGVVDGGEAVVGGDDEDGTGGEFGGDTYGVPGWGVGDDLFGEALRCAAGERCNAFGGEGGGETARGFVFGSGFEGLHFACAHVGGGDEDDGFDRGVLGGGVSSHEAAHAVADEHDRTGVGAELLCSGWIAKEGDGGLRVFEGVGEREVAGRTPGAAIVEVEDVPACATDGLGEVEVLLVAGKAVEEDCNWMRTSPFCDVGDGVQHGSVAGELKALDGRWVGFVGDGVCGEG